MVIYMPGTFKFIWCQLPSPAQTPPTAKTLTPKGTPHTSILAMCALSDLDESHLPSHFTTLVLNLPSRVREQHWFLVSSLKTARMPPVRILGAGG